MSYYENENFLCKPVNEFLRETRLTTGFSQSSFAKKLGISKQRLCDLEKGRRKISPKRWLEYAEKIGCNPHMFIMACFKQILIDSEINVNILKNFKFF